MQKYVHTAISYLKEGADEASHRVIIPTTLPIDNVKAVDVTDLSDAEVAELEKLLAEYGEYKDQFIAKMFTFDDWLSHTSVAQPKLKWRTFKSSGITEAE